MKVKPLKPWVSPIPKLVHLIWIGNQDYPDYFKLFLKTFYKYLPEFTIKVWGNKDLTRKNFPKTFTYIQKAKKVHGKQMIDDEGNEKYTIKGEPMTYSKWAQITDLMRLEIVYNHGGFYFDTTFEILKPMYTLLNKRQHRFIGCNEVPRFKDYGKLSNSFFGATKHNVILKRLLLKKNLNTIDFLDPQVEYQTGPYYLRNGIRSTDNYKILPTKTMYPFIEPLDSYNDPPYRKSKKNKCHSNKKTKRNSRKLKNKKGYISYPCKRYPKSYALKHWQLGKSWLNYLDEYITL